MGFERNFKLQRRWRGHVLRRALHMLHFFCWKQVKLIESYRPGKSSSSIRDSILMTFRPSWVSWSSLTFGKESEDLFDMFCLMTSQKIPPSVVLLFKEQFFYGIIFFMLWGIFQLGKTCKILFWNFFENQDISRNSQQKFLWKFYVLTSFQSNHFKNRQKIIIFDEKCLPEKHFKKE